ncbi:hypothetical protein RGZ1_107 [Morganella phage vB_MmoM_Rgz1]|nr:hypothetical protein RGZ1_107 [Morganella phage vB_MmoM_Rgz1]
MIIEVEIPDHLAKVFLSWMSESGEQEFPVWAEDHRADNTFICFDIPGWKDKIVISEMPV